MEDNGAKQGTFGSGHSESVEEKNDKKRKTRNLNEKKRRDQFNVLINELMSLVSQGNEKKMDKSLVLRTTINLLTKHKDIKRRTEMVTADVHPSFLTTPEFCQLILEAADGFIIVINQQGGIVFVSENVLSILGHEPSSMINRQIYYFVHSSEYSEFCNQLQGKQAEAVDHGEFRSAEHRVEFSCHFLRFPPKEPKGCQYEHCRLVGSFKQISKPMTEESTRCLVAAVRTVAPVFYKNILLIDKTSNEFKSRLSLEWKFLLLEHKASSIIGYLPFEVLGTCSYDYNHFDDLNILTDCHQKLLQYGAVMSGHYRFLTKGHQWIWLKTHFYITYNQWNSKPEFISCTNRVVSYSDVLKAKLTIESVGPDRASDSEPSFDTSQPSVSEQLSIQSDFTDSSSKSDSLNL